MICCEKCFHVFHDEVFIWKRKNMWLVKCRYKKVLGFCASDYRQNHDLLHHCYDTTGILLLIVVLLLLCLLWPLLHVVTYYWHNTASAGMLLQYRHTTATLAILLLLLAFYCFYLHSTASTGERCSGERYILIWKCREFRLSNVFTKGDHKGHQGTVWPISYLSQKCQQNTIQVQEKWNRLRFKNFCNLWLEQRLRDRNATPHGVCS